MASCTHALTTTLSGSADNYTTTAFTPATNDLLVVMVSAATTIATGSVTNSAGIAFTEITSTTYLGSGTNTTYLFVATGLASGISQTVTFFCTGDKANCVTISILRISGMTKTGTNAILQSAVLANQSTGTPVGTFSQTTLTGSVTIGIVGFYGGSSGQTVPAGWTEQSDAGVSNGSAKAALEYVTRDSGYTGTTITWGGASSVNYDVIIAELDATGGSAPANASFLLLMV